MTKMKAIFSIMSMLMMGTYHAYAAGWPQLRGDHRHRQCVQVLQLAEAAFHSNAMYLYGPHSVPSGFGSTTALQPTSSDTASGDNLLADSTVFQKLAAGGGRSYWQTMSQYGYRLVVREMTQSWQGEVYSLFSVSDALNAEDAINAVTKGQKQEGARLIWDYAWKPPIVLQDRHTNALWLIDVGQPYVFLSDWGILLPTARGLSQVCTVVFHPPAKSAADLLPPPVREFAKLLDESIGGDNNEGTLRPIDRIRTDIQHTLANAALRPWALTDPYNTRQELDAGLASWSREDSSHATTYQNILRQYPLAERSLADYYRNRFKRKPAEAKLLAAYVMDIVFRSYYVFHSDDPEKYLRRDHPAANPWG